jgi:hypothetical protein
LQGIRKSLTFAVPKQKEGKKGDQRKADRELEKRRQEGLERE